MANSERRLELGGNDDGRRLDRVLRKLLPDQGLGPIYRALRRRDIRINGTRAHPDTRVYAGDLLTVRGPLAHLVQLPTATSNANPVEPDRIIHANNHVLVVNKLVGELTHGEESLLQRVEAYWLHHGIREEVGGVSFRPGPVHRLDRNTSGLVMFALSTEGAQEASRVLHDRAAQKDYLAVLSGTLTQEVTWAEAISRDHEQNKSTTDLSGQDARTVVQPLVWTGNETVALITIESGRTHQIRVHAAAHGHPLTGDHKYGDPDGTGYLLHAVRLRINEQNETLGFRELVAPVPLGVAHRLVHRFSPGLKEALRQHGLGGALE